MDELTATTYNNGDTAVVKALIADDPEKPANSKYSYTAYVYNKNKETPGWEAMDGNYNAKNVYFSDDIMLAGDYAAVGNVKLADKTL